MCPESWHPTLNALTRSAAKTSSGTISSGESSSGEIFASAVPPPPPYQGQQRPVGESAVTGFMSGVATDVASALAVQTLQALFQQ